MTTDRTHGKTLAKFLRDLSHSLYSPLLDLSGLVVASKSLCNEFKTRNGLEIKADIASELPPLDDELALCLYRVLQECLQNIVKHAGRCNVNVLLKSSQRQIRFGSIRYRARLCYDRSQHRNWFPHHERARSLTGRAFQNM